MAPPRFHSDSRHFERARDVRLLLAPSQNSAARRFLQRPATPRLHLGNSVWGDRRSIGAGDLQTGPTVLAHGGVRRLRCRAGRAFELPGPARAIYGDAPDARRIASADDRHDGDRGTAWLGVS